MSTHPAPCIPPAVTFSQPLLSPCQEQSCSWEGVSGSLCPLPAPLTLPPHRAGSGLCMPPGPWAPARLGGCGGALDGREAEGRLRLHLGSRGGWVHFQTQRGRGAECALGQRKLGGCENYTSQHAVRRAAGTWEGPRSNSGKPSPPPAAAAVVCLPDCGRGRASWGRTEPSASGRSGLLRPRSTHTHGHVPAWSKAQPPTPQQGPRVRAQHADPCPPACRCASARSDTHTRRSPHPTALGP